MIIANEKHTTWTLNLLILLSVYRPNLQNRSSLRIPTIIKRYLRFKTCRPKPIFFYARTFRFMQIRRACLYFQNKRFFFNYVHPKQVQICAFSSIMWAPTRINRYLRSKLPARPKQSIICFQNCRPHQNKSLFAFKTVGAAKTNHYFALRNKNSSTLLARALYANSSKRVFPPHLFSKINKRPVRFEQK